MATACPVEEEIARRQAARTPLGYWLLVTAVMAATLLQFLDQTIANVAIPHMQTSLNASLDTVSWVLTSFIVATAVVTPAAGWVAGRYGTRRPFLLAVVGFIIASMLCGTAVNLFEMVLFRILQGIAAAFIGPLAQTILLDTTPRQFHARALSMWGVTGMIGPVIGPTLGGFLTDSFNWRWVFYINVPIGIPAALVLWRRLPDAPGAARSFDLGGYVALAIALASFQLMLDRGQTNDWFDSIETVFEAALAAIAFGVFLINSRFAEHPLIPGPLLRNRAVLVALFYSATSSWITMGVSAMVPSLYQNVYGLTVLQAGEVMAPRGIGTMMMMMLGPRFMTRMTYRDLLMAGFSLITLSLWQMTGWTLVMPRSAFAIAALIQGFGMGLLLMPLNMMAFAAIPPALRTDCAGLFSLVRYMSGSAAISLFVLVQTRSAQVMHFELAGGIDPARMNAAGNALSGIGASAMTVVQLVNAEVSRQAALIGYLNVFQLLFVLCALSIPLSVFARGRAQ